MTRIPGYMWLGGDDEGGVWLQCRHPHHDNAHHVSVAHHGGGGPAYADGLPHFPLLNDFIDFIHAHARGHDETP